MYGKDDRMKGHRKNAQKHNNYYKQQRRSGGGTPGNTSSSSPQTTAVRSIVDVADSSDEPRFACGTSGWLPPQKNRELVGAMPPLDNDENAEFPVDENVRAQLRAGDYKQMSQFPTLGGGHLFIGVEKEWNAVVEGQNKLHTQAAASYFTLNLSLLKCGLQTIPFYKRMDYQTSMFTRQEINTMNEAAERAEKAYQQQLQRQNKRNAEQPRSRPATAKSIIVEPAAAAVSDELDELLALTSTQLTLTTPALPLVAAATTTPSDVEQWLDSVLDE